MINGELNHLPINSPTRPLKESDLSLETCVSRLTSYDLAINNHSLHSFTNFTLNSSVHFYVHWTTLLVSYGLYARINSALDARMLVHFRLWRLKRRKTEENGIMTECSIFTVLPSLKRNVHTFRCNFIYSYVYFI